MTGGTDLAAPRAALSAAAQRTAELIRGIDAPASPTTGLTWTLAETAAHLVMGLRGYTDAVRGDLDGWRAFVPDLPVFRDRLVAVTQSTLATVPERDPETLARLLVEAAARFLAASAGLGGDHVVDTPWYGEGESLRLADATALLLGEQLIHGRDLALSLRRRWPIPRDDALLAAPATQAMIPKAVKVEATRDLDLTYAFHLRGGGGFTVHVDHGAAACGPLGGRRADCHLSFQPVAFLLVGYGRISPWAAIARGGVLAYGRRPWLGLRFKTLFHDP